ncbi:zinc metalloprotease HtpX [Secundilactobacillus paracollinoides]|uniref:Protease HtpX homolog n=1 Tax=Secundilactobacillus paracollinoides TaxID=240427 RepID=A0A1B2IXV0_9LACO|nr:zinc metalloprotease HtpX [Secundilactobacillus paracollinoides]ANZ60969.1 protease HtpX [Secundilactobacillus paracollinoides]ANZ66828.1 protease HtpX [Secundilactobacillus paracollinoides]KRL80411.1 heat shock protein HtpX [Secundilactobacillus paracollinoides DSM 15502 = JCM 11969]
MLFEQIARNKRRTIYVLIGFVLLLIAIGYALGYVFYNNGVIGMVIAVVVAAVYCAIMIGNSTSVVMSMNHAREIKRAEDAPELWHVVEDMALVARVPMPRVFIIDDPSPNAFATGNDPKHAAVAATSGILDRLNREELEGVMGHEMTHVRNYDIRLQTIALALSAAIGLLVNFASHWFWWGGGDRRRGGKDSEGNGYVQLIMMVISILLLILGPVAATIAQMALSRNREYLADAGSVELTRNPQGLISALEKISDSKPMKKADPSSAAMYISDPFKKKRSMTHLFDTHPPMEERIERLEKM